MVNTAPRQLVVSKHASGYAARAGAAVWICDLHNPLVIPSLSHGQEEITLSLISQAAILNRPPLGDTCGSHTLVDHVGRLRLWSCMLLILASDTVQKAGHLCLLDHQHFIYTFAGRASIMQVFKLQRKYPQLDQQELVSGEAPTTSMHQQCRAQKLML